MKIKHAFISPKTDSTDTSIIKPVHWNADHVIETTQAGVVLGRRLNESAGPVQELPVKVSTVSVMLNAFTGLFRPPSGNTVQRPPAVDCKVGDIRVNTDTKRLEIWDGFIWTNLAIGEIAFTGQLEFALRNTAPTGWIAFYGSIGPPNSMATNHNNEVHALYDLCWDLPVAKFAMLDGLPRGGSKASDWAGLRPILLPDWRGRGFAIAEDIGGAGAAAANIISGGAAGGFVDSANAFDIAGEKSHVLTQDELAKHAHTLYDPANKLIQQNLGGTGSGTQVWSNNADNDTGEVGDDAPHNIIQPTVMLYCYVKL
jgi:hypothetical protein